MVLLTNDAFQILTWILSLVGDKYNLKFYYPLLSMLRFLVFVSGSLKAHYRVKFGNYAS